MITHFRKKRGELPTGQLFHTAKATGFKSVSEMLVAKTSEHKEVGSIVGSVLLSKQVYLCFLVKETPMNANSCFVNNDRSINMLLAQVLNKFQLPKLLHP